MNVSFFQSVFPLSSLSVAEGWQAAASVAPQGISSAGPSSSQETYSISRLATDDSVAMFLAALHQGSPVSIFKEDFSHFSLRPHWQSQ